MMQNARTLYRPDPIQPDTANNDLFETVRIPLVFNAAFPVQPIRISSIIGQGFYVDRCDLPCTITANGKDAPIQFQARNGMVFEGSFKGLSISAPACTQSTQNSAAMLVLVVFKGAARINPQNVSEYLTLSQGSYTVTQNIGTQITCLVYVPPGARELTKLKFYLEGTTIVGAYAQMVYLENPTGSLNIASLLGVIDSRNLVNYSGNHNASIMSRTTAVAPLFGGAAAAQIEFDAPVPIWDKVNALACFITGTGLLSPNSSQFTVAALFK